jgi:hypothetical protein
MKRTLHSIVAFAVITASCAAATLIASPAYGATVSVSDAAALNTAIANAQPGDVIALTASTFTDPEIEITRAGTAGAPITLRGQGPGASNINGVIKIRGSVQHWVFEGFSLNAAGAEDGMRIDAGSRDLVFRNFSLANGSGYGIRVDDNVANITIEDCEISRFINSGTDAHGIGIQVADNIAIRRCYIHDNSGDGIQSHTNDEPGANAWATNIIVEANRIERNGENAVDVKSTKTILIRNNVMSGYRAAGGGEGIAIQIQYDAQNVTVMGNTVHDAVMGIELTRGRKDGSDYPKAPSNVRIIGNLFRDLVFDSSFSNAGNGTGIVFRGSTNVRVYNNTVLRAPSAAFYMGRGNNGEFVSNMDARNNLFDGGKNDLDYNSDIDALPGITFSHNHFVHGTVRGKPLSGWTSGLRDAHASSGDPKVDASGIPQPGSPLIDTGIDVGMPFAGAAPNRGWDEFAAGNAPVPTPGPTVTVPTPGPTATARPPATINPLLTLRVYLPFTRKRK